MDQQDFRRKAAEIERLATQAEADVSSDDHAVRVIVGPGGALKDLELSHRAYSLSGAELGEKIVETLKMARTQVDQELSASISSVLGVDVSSGGFGGKFADFEDEDEQENQR